MCCTKTLCILYCIINVSTKISCIYIWPIICYVSRRHVVKIFLFDQVSKLHITRNRLTHNPDGLLVISLL